VAVVPVGEEDKNRYANILPGQYTSLTSPIHSWSTQKQPLIRKEQKKGEATTKVLKILTVPIAFVFF